MSNRGQRSTTGRFSVFVIIASMLVKRIVFNLVIFLLIVLAPWPLYSAMIIAGVFLFNKFTEAFAWLVVLQLLYGSNTLVGSEQYFFWYMIGALLVSLVFKKMIRFYD